MLLCIFLIPICCRPGKKKEQFGQTVVIFSENMFRIIAWPSVTSSTLRERNIVWMGSRGEKEPAKGLVAEVTVPTASSCKANCGVPASALRRVLYSVLRKYRECFFSTRNNPAKKKIPNRLFLGNLIEALNFSLQLCTFVHENFFTTKSQKYAAFREETRTFKESVFLPWWISASAKFDTPTDLLSSHNL